MERLGNLLEQLIDAFVSIGAVDCLPARALLQASANRGFLAVHMDQVTRSMVLLGNVAEPLPVLVTQIGRVDDNGPLRCQTVSGKIQADVVDKLVFPITVAGERDEDAADTISANHRDRGVGRQFPGEMGLAHTW